MYRPTGILLMLCVLAGLPVAISHGRTAGESRWEKDIAAFEEWDARNTFPAGAVLFVGSSSIRMWQTQKSFPDLPVINRGFGGSQVSDVNQFAERIVLKYSPRLIVFYAGDNDIAAGKSPGQVLADYRAFVGLVHRTLPRTPIIYMAIKPSRSRWTLWPRMEKANSLIRDYSAGDTRLFFVDGASPLLGEDGRPDDKFYLDDKLHLSAEGYKVWTELLDPIRLIAKVNLEGKSLALLLIKQGMGPHRLPPEKLAEIANTPVSPGSAGGRSTTPTGDYTCVASKNSKVFHRSNCPFVGRIAEKNRITFAGRAAAVNTGRRPCKTCNP